MPSDQGKPPTSCPSNARRSPAGPARLPWGWPARSPARSLSMCLVLLPRPVSTATNKLFHRDPKRDRPPSKEQHQPPAATGPGDSLRPPRPCTGWTPHSHEDTQQGCRPPGTGRGPTSRGPGPHPPGPTSQEDTLCCSGPIGRGRNEQRPTEGQAARHPIWKCWQLPPLLNAQSET